MHTRILFLALAIPVFAQQIMVTRSVFGRVTNAAGVPIKKSVVYLENTTLLGFRSCLTSDDGTFRFIEVSAADDFKIRARYKNDWSTTIDIGHESTSDNLEVNLVITPANPGGCAPSRPGC